jgi:hypothetical protein
LPVRRPKAAQHVLLCLGAMEPHQPLACLTQPVHPHQGMQDPPRRRLVHPFPRLVRTRRCMVFARLAETGFQGGIDQPAHRHHHP